MEYSFCYINFKDIPIQRYKKDFTFIVDGKRYEIPRIVADLLSPKVRNFHYIDESLDEFYFDTKNDNDNDIDLKDEDYFKSFLELCTKDHIQLDSIHRKVYSIYFFKLGNINEYLKIHPEYTTPLSTENAIDRLLAIERLTINISEQIDQPTINIAEIISFIASHFDDISKDKMKQLPIHFLREIIDSEQLKISEEDSLLDFVLNLYAEDHSYSDLLSSVLFYNLSEKSIEKFVKTIEFEDVNQHTWRSVCERLAPSTISPQRDRTRYNKQNKYREFKLEEGRELDGILKYLTKKTGGNIHDNGTIEITSNSIYNDNNSLHPKNLVDFEKTNVYESKNQPDIFVCFDFKDMQIQLSDYSIKSGGDGQNGWHLRNWAIEVSNDGKSWEEVDRHSNDSTLNGSYITSSYKISNERKEFYRYVRIHQTGISWNGHPNSQYYYVEMCCFELFGKIEEKSIIEE
ncbi:hypothetical protein M9Y10_027149 [Tritrichomonas musculus]|uniref:BACK domain-containing protein n=1 Tax=Tritrichomonas musculus TaxID=1915356 RepID=A0ABR2H5M6_9EUKA